MNLRHKIAANLSDSMFFLLNQVAHLPICHLHKVLLFQCFSFISFGNNIAFCCKMGLVLVGVIDQCI